jgi:hypothetical protein
MTDEQYTEAVGRAGLTFADGVLATARKEAKGCLPRWDKYLCWLKQIKAAQVDKSFYNVVESIAGMDHANPVLDPTAQPPGGVTIIISPGTLNQPSAREVRYGDVHWDDDHLVYTDTSWAGFSLQIYINGQRFLEEGVEFTQLSTGGFSLASPMVDGDIYYVIF